MRRLRSILALGCIALFAFVLAGCSSPIAADRGGLSIAFATDLARTLSPGVSMVATSYTVTGAGPNGAAFSASSTGEAVNSGSLAFGAWTVVVNALNASGTLIGTGTATAQVVTGTTTAVTVNVSPVAGTGTLSLAVSWPAAQVQTPAINASLTPAQGSAQSLGFELSGSSASYMSPALGAGYYTLAFTLNDNAKPVAGAVEVVRIVAGEATSGTYAFTNVNAPGGAIAVNINANLQNPLLVDIAGGSATMSATSTQTLSASVSNYSGNVTYVWYVNGVSVATGTSFTFGGGLVVGYNYRVDVAAYSADGSRAGSSTQNVSIVAAPPAMAWTASAVSTGPYSLAAAYGNGRFVVVAVYGQVAVSTDGITWTQGSLPVSSMPSSMGIDSWMDIAYGNGVFVVLNHYGNAMTSADGIVWTDRALPSKASWKALTYGSGRFVALAGGANKSNEAAISADGVTWTAQTLPSVEDWQSVIYGNGVFVAVAGGVSDSTVAATSSDGIIWITRSLPRTVAWTSVAFGNGLFLAIPRNTWGTTAATSPDGINWTARTLPISRNWSDVAFGNGIFVILAADRSIASYDGSAWTSTELNLGTTSTNNALVYGGGRFVALAPSSTLAWTSP